MRITGNSSQSLMIQGTDNSNVASGISEANGFSFRQSLGTKLSEKGPDHFKEMKISGKTDKGKEGPRPVKPTKKAENTESTEYTILSAAAVQGAIRNVENTVQENPDPQVWRMIEALMTSETQDLSVSNAQEGTATAGLQTTLLSGMEEVGLGSKQVFVQELNRDTEQDTGILKQETSKQDAIALKSFDRPEERKQEEAPLIKAEFIERADTEESFEPVLQKNGKEVEIREGELNSANGRRLEKNEKVLTDMKKDDKEDGKSGTEERMFSTLGRIERFGHENHKVKEVAHLNEWQDDGIRLHILEQIRDFADRHNLLSYKQGVELTLNPAGLGKIGIVAKQLSTGVAISIACENNRTYKLLSESSQRLGNIMEKRLGEPTVVHIAEKNTDYLQQNRQQEGNREGYRQEHREDRKNETDSFVARLKFGLS